MSMKWIKVLGSSAAILLWALSTVLGPACAQTNESTTPLYTPETAGDFIIKDFHFNSGEVLQQLRVHYVTLSVAR